MKKVMFWQVSDTIINELDPSKTFIVVAIEPKLGGNWVILQNVHTNEFINGYEIGLQAMKYIGYRKDNTYNPIFA